MENIEISNLLIIVGTVNTTVVVLLTGFVVLIKKNEISGFLKRLHKLCFESLTLWAKDGPNECKW